jgi:hypothetical protein
VIDLYVVVAHEDGFCVVTAIDYGRENYDHGYREAIDYGHENHDQGCHMYYLEEDLSGPGQHDVIGYFAAL